MRLTDPAWTEKWSQVRFASAPQGILARVRALAGSLGARKYGTDREPGSSLWLASLSEAMGGTFREGMTVFDYGCGAGRYAHFLRQRLARFTYYGLEKPGSRSRHGEASIVAAQKAFRTDGRMSFGLIGGALEQTALAQADVVVLGSVFTHVDFHETRRILTKLQPVALRGGKIVFSIFIADAYRLERPGAYGFDDCYNRAWFTAAQLQQICDELLAVADEKETFLAQKVNLHRIFTLTRKSTERTSC